MFSYHQLAAQLFGGSRFYETIPLTLTIVLSFEKLVAGRLFDHGSAVLDQVKYG